MADLNLDLSGIKPLLGQLGLGQTPAPAVPINARPLPPMPPPPTPAQAGFSLWNADPKNQQTVANSLTMPGTPITPPSTPPASPLSASPTPPPPAPVKPLGQGPENPMAGVQPLAPAQAQQASMSADMAANPDQYQKPQLVGQGWKGLLKFGIPAALMSAGSGLSNMGRGDPTAGFKLLDEQAARDRGVPAANQAEYDLRNVKPLQQAAAIADTQSQTAERSALAAKANALSDYDAPITMTKDQASAINHPELAGTQVTMRDYNKALVGAGNNNTSAGNNQRTNDTKETIATSKAAIAALKPKQRDDQYISIMSKPAAERTPDELAFKSGYEQYIKTSKTDPGIARGVASAMARPLQTVDPNTNNVIYQKAGDAIRTGAAAPTSMDYAAEKGLQKDFTSGAASKNLNAFNTASAHLATLGQAAEALHNGDVQAINRIGNEYNKQTGSPAPTNFQAVKSAVAGEVSKTFKGGQATDAEIKEFNDAVGSANSPAQLRGVISTYQELMDSKRQALQQQYSQGMQGKPNFGTPSVGGNTPGGGNDSISVQIPGQAPGTIHASQLAAFKAKYPNAKVGK